MSDDLGWSESYINKIENNKILPSMRRFFIICDYLKLTQEEFFNEGIENPELLNEIIKEYKRMNEESQSQIMGLMKQLK